MKYPEGKSLEAECILVTSRSWGKEGGENGKHCYMDMGIKEHSPQHSNLKKNMTYIIRGGKRHKLKKIYYSCKDLIKHNINQKKVGTENQ